MVPGVVLGLMASMSKFCDAGYATIFDEDKVNICNVENKKYPRQGSRSSKGDETALAACGKFQSSNQLWVLMIAR